MYLTNEEAFKDLNKKGLFLCRSGKAGTGKQVIALKTDKDSFKEVTNPNEFFNKVANNVLISTDTPLCNDLDLQVFVDYDERNAEIEANKAIVKNLKPKKFLSIKRAVLCRGYGNYFAVDVDNIKAIAIEPSLIDEEELSEYRKDAVMNALRETGINIHEKEFDHQTKIWKEIGK